MKKWGDLQLTLYLCFWIIVTIYNLAKLIVQKILVMLSIIHQATPQTSTQPWVVSLYHDDNHEPIQPFDEIVSTRQRWQFATLCYYLLRNSAPTPIATSTNFENQPSNTNINLVNINLVMEWLQLFNKLK